MIEKKTIVLYIASMHRGGAERVMSIIANSLAEFGYGVILATDVAVEKNSNNYSLSEKIECVNIKVKSKNILVKNIQRMSRLRRLIKMERADVVLSFLGRQNYRMLLATIGLKCRKCVSVRNDPNMEYGKSKIRKWIANRIFILADVCIFQTKDAKQYFNVNIQKKSVIIPNPVDKKFFNVKRSKNPKNIVSVGRLEPQKNHKLLIDAFAAINNKISGENLLIYGSGSLKCELLNYIKELGLSDKILLKGETDVVEKELARCKVFVLPSDYEGMPNALMEAMAVGLPCVSTDCPSGGPRDLIKNGKNGWLVPCRNVQKLSEAIVFAVENVNKKNIIVNMDTYRIEKVVSRWEDVLFDMQHEKKDSEDNN